MTVAPHWIELDGAENVRDLAGLPTTHGQTVQPGRLLRSDSLQQLSERDVRLLVDELGVRAVADLRTGVEVASEGQGPMHREPAVTVHHLSLFPEADRAVDGAGADPGAAVVLPWQQRRASATEDDRRRGASGVYQRYLVERPDSVIAALRLIAYTDGATLVHCAAGKDRTGVVVALALSEVGVDADAIIEDYARSAERVEAIIARLSARPTYAGDLGNADPEQHKPRAETMRAVLADVQRLHGGASGWLREHGWTEDDAAALRHHLLTP